MFRRQVGLACPSSAPVVGLLPVISSQYQVRRPRDAGKCGRWWLVGKRQL